MDVGVQDSAIARVEKSSSGLVFKVRDEQIGTLHSSSYALVRTPADPDRILSLSPLVGNNQTVLYSIGEGAPPKYI